MLEQLQIRSRVTLIACIKGNYTLKLPSQLLLLYRTFKNQTDQLHLSYFLQILNINFITRITNFLYSLLSISRDVTFSEVCDSKYIFWIKVCLVYSCNLSKDKKSIILTGLVVSMLIFIKSYA